MSHGGARSLLHEGHTVNLLVSCTATSLWFIVVSELETQASSCYCGRVLYSFFFVSLFFSFHLIPHWNLQALSSHLWKRARWTWNAMYSSRSITFLNHSIHHKSGSNECKDKQTNITKLTLSRYINRNIMVNRVSECVYKLSYQLNCTRLKSRF